MDLRKLCVNKRVRRPKLSRFQSIAAMLMPAALLVIACQPVMPVDVGSPANVPASAEAAPVATDVPESSPTPTGMTVPTDASSAPEVVAADQTLVDEGMAVYRAQYCGICHELEAAGTTGSFGPSHNGVGPRAQQRIEDPRYSGDAKTPDAYLYESLVRPEAYIVEGYVATAHRMPPYTHLSEDDLRALVAFLMQLR